ncbi:MAG: hypothetical protein HY554_00115 [Elusimicrobia bacterium]|nr:hypothetical protein [Elusimicrobiota bacterium]
MPRRILLAAVLFWPSSGWGNSGLVAPRSGPLPPIAVQGAARVALSEPLLGLLAPAATELPAPPAIGALRVQADLPAPALAAPGQETAGAALQATETGLIGVADIDGALAALGAASYPLGESERALIAGLAERYPALPIAADRLFLVREPRLLARLGIPEDAGGAARILTDGRREVQVILLSAVSPVPLDDFVEFAIHEAVHLADDGILRVPHGEEALHWLAEGYTQLRSHPLANGALAGLGRPARSGWQAYSDEIALVQAVIARHGREPLEALVTRGDAGGLASALGPRWRFMRVLAARRADGTRPPRARFLAAFKAIVEATAWGPDERAAVLAYLY